MKLMINKTGTDTYTNHA